MRQDSTKWRSGQDNVVRSIAEYDNPDRSNHVGASARIGLISIYYLIFPEDKAVTECASQVRIVLSSGYARHCYNFPQDGKLPKVEGGTLIVRDKGGSVDSFAGGRLKSRASPF